LQADYVNVTAAYMASSFLTMSRWHNNWWESEYLPDGGYPEYYLKQCCSFDGLLMDSKIKLPTTQAKTAAKDRKPVKDNKVVTLCLGQSEDGYLYPHTEALRLALQSKGVEVRQVKEGQDKATKQSFIKMLGLLSESDLMVAKPNTQKWLADAIGCPTLLISGATEPKVFMPDFATDPTSPCPVHAQHHGKSPLAFTQQCNCDDPWLLADNIESILSVLGEELPHV
jgi:hypothetical protein